MVTKFFRKSNFSDFLGIKPEISHSGLFTSTNCQSLSIFWPPIFWLFRPIPALHGLFSPIWVLYVYFYIKWLSSKVKSHYLGSISEKILETKTRVLIKNRLSGVFELYLSFCHRVSLSPWCHQFSILQISESKYSYH